VESKKEEKKELREEQSSDVRLVDQSSDSLYPRLE
jgi:hypothetical protein